MTYSPQTGSSTLLSPDDSGSFLRGRKEEIFGYIRELGRPLKKCQAQRAETPSSEGKRAGKVNSTRVEVLSLQPTAKARYCSTLDHFLATLCHSTKKFSEIIISPPSTLDDNEGLSAVLLETIVAVLSWLSMDSSSGVEITTGIRTWYSAERAHLEQRSRGGTHVAEGTLLKKLRKLEQRVDELESSLQRLGRSLDRAKSSGPSLDFIKSVDAIVPTDPKLIWGILLTLIPLLYNHAALHEQADALELGRLGLTALLPLL